MTLSLKKAAERAVERAKKLGARQADAWAESSRESSVRVRDGEVEDLQQATSRGLGVRVIAAGRLGFAYGSDLERAGVDALVERALALARSSAPDPANRLPSAKALAERRHGLELLDPAVVELSTDWKIEAAKTMERVGRALDRRVAAFESVGAQDVVAEAAIASSEGLTDSYQGSAVTLYSAPVVRADDGQLQTGWWLDSKRFLSDLDGAEEIGRRAAERALRMLGAGKGPTRRVPVILEPAQAASFFAGIAAALDGKRVHQRASFLAGKLGARIGPRGFHLVDDGLHPRGLGSRPFDGDGLAARRTALIRDGQLENYLYDTYTAFKAKAKSTASARRGYQGLPHIGTATLLVDAEQRVPAAEIVRDVKDGLYVTATLGHGADVVTGDYSLGAAGLWVENGELTRPVQAMTIAGNLRDMLGSIDAIGDDLELRGSVGAPTIRFAELTVAGG